MSTLIMGLVLSAIFFWTNVAVASDNGIEYNQRIKALIVQLGDKQTRPMATRELREIGKPALSMLCQAFDDSDLISHQEAIARFLVESGNDGMPYLIKGLGSSWGAYQCEEALVKIGKAAVLDLIKELENNDDQIRGNAMRALGRIGDKSAFEALMAVAEKDFPVHVSHRAAPDHFMVAIQSLGSLGDQRAVEPLHQYLQKLTTTDPLTGERSIASIDCQFIIDSLTEIGGLRVREILVEIVVDGGPSSEYAIDSLFELHVTQSEMPALIKIAHSYNMDREKQWSMITSAVAANKGQIKAFGPVIDELLNHLKGVNLGARWAALKALKPLQEYPKVRSVVSPILSDEVLYKIYALGASPFNNPTKTENCKWAAEWLGSSKDPRAIPALESALDYWENSPFAQVRKYRHIETIYGSGPPDIRKDINIVASDGYGSDPVTITAIQEALEKARNKAVPSK